MSDSTYQALPGYALVEPEQKYTDTGLIALPEKYSRKKKAVARVKKWKPEFRLRCGHCGGIQHYRGSCAHCQRRDRLRAISTGQTAPFNADITGSRVLYLEHAVARITDDLYRIPIDSILAILPDDLNLDDAGDEQKRCRFCGPAREGSPNGMMLLPKGGKLVCPRCKMDENGMVVA